MFGIQSTSRYSSLQFVLCVMYHQSLPATKYFNVIMNIYVQYIVLYSKHHFPSQVHVCTCTACVSKAVLQTYSTFCTVQCTCTHSIVYTVRTCTLYMYTQYTYCIIHEMVCSKFFVTRGCRHPSVLLFIDSRAFDF